MLKLDPGHRLVSLVPFWSLSSCSLRFYVIMILSGFGCVGVAETFHIHFVCNFALSYGGLQ